MTVKELIEKSELEIPYGWFNGHMLTHYCTPLDVNYDELWKTN